jgi:hypothetical protein
LDVVTVFLNPEVDDNDIYMVLAETWLEGLDAHIPPIIVRLRTALYNLNQAPRLSHSDSNAFLHFLRFTVIVLATVPNPQFGSGSGLEPK